MLYNSKTSNLLQAEQEQRQRYAVKVQPIKFGYISVTYHVDICHAAKGAGSTAEGFRQKVRGLAKQQPGLPPQF
jgi:hypothetical protein